MRGEKLEGGGVMGTGAMKQNPTVLTGDVCCIGCEGCEESIPHVT